ncbi:MAG: Asp-tRNA(Asn)/Glu-tRNA(Gln) amidotransferase subunit GatA, partial [Oscillospiraceae bacterium]|nr:Asp-tRNA(Asn)/Glu-tRNA(Gln) amidotransferase subunit GatA [Oscillospiraceae bacterium]
AYYKRAKLLQKKIVAEFNDIFQKYDIILTPTVPTTAFPIGAEIEDPIKMHFNDVNTVSSNIAGIPAVSLPCGKDDSNLPIGLQLIGNYFEEKKLLTIAKCCESLVGCLDLPSID